MLNSADRTAARDAIGGFTLIELLTVMFLMALLMGIGVGALARMGKGSALDNAERVVRAALVRARVAATTRAALCSVVVLPAEVEAGVPARLRLALSRDAGTWHFDEEGVRALGGRNHYAVLRGAQRIDGGTLGRCVRVGRADAVVCPPDVFFDPTLGFSLTLDVRPDPEKGMGTIARYGETFSLDLTGQGVIEAQVTTMPEEQVISLKTGKDVVVPGRWSRVGLVFDGLEVLLLAHSVVEDRKPVASRRLVAPGPQESLVLCGSSFHGSIDEVLYRTRLFEDQFEFDGDVVVPVAQGVEVRFTHEGRLDERLHASAPVVIPLELEGERTKIVVDASGVAR